MRATTEILETDQIKIRISCELSAWEWKLIRKDLSCTSVASSRFVGLIENAMDRLLTKIKADETHA